MIVDSSALIAILRSEPEAELFSKALEGADGIQISAATLLESLIVAGPNRRDEVYLLLQESEAQVIPFDETHLRSATQGHDVYGRGSGSKARLNFGDCFSYALAMSLDEPLLFKGDDFTHTDVTPALKR